MFTTTKPVPEALSSQESPLADLHGHLAELYHALETASFRAVKNAGMDEAEEIALLQDIQAFLSQEFGEFLVTRSLVMENFQNLLLPKDKRFTVIH